MTEDVTRDQPVEIQNQPAKPWLKIALLSLTGLFLAGGLVWAGYYKLGRIRQLQFGPKLPPTPTAVATPTPHLTTGWETYTNTELGFSVKYPENFPEPEERLLATRTEVEFGSTASIGVGVYYDQEKQRELTYLEIARQYSNGKKEPQTTTIDGHTAAYLEMREEDLVAPKPDPFIIVTIQKGKTVYMIYYSFDTLLSDQENEQIFSLIVSTFRFLE